MVKLKQLGQPEKKRMTDTIIGDGLVFTSASLKGSGVIRIDGHFTGNIDIDGHIILGETGVICGDVHADSALIAGQLTGNLTITDTLHLTSTADLEGKIKTGTLKIDEGAAFAAACTVAKKSDWKDIEDVVTITVDEPPAFPAAAEAIPAAVSAPDKPASEAAPKKAKPGRPASEAAKGAKAAQTKRKTSGRKSGNL